MSLRDECANEDCRHAPETHYLDTISTGNLDPSYIKVRTACLARGCPCTYYVPPHHSRR